MLPNTLSTWEAALRNRSSSLFDNYRRFRQRAEAAARGEMEEVGYLADQGRGSRLQQLLARLVPERIGNALTPAELFFLLSASWALDLAWRAPETGQPYEVADPRERYRFLTEWPDRWALSLRQAQVLRRICSSTRVPGRNLSLYTPQHAFVGRDAVNVHLLTALLRLASALDVEYTTHIPEAVREQLSPKQWSAWPQILGASVGLIDSREWIIRVDVTSPTAEQERLLRTEFQAHAQRELDEVRNLLLDSGLAYRRVDLQVNAGLEVPAPTLEVPPSALSKRRHERPFKFLDSFEPEDAPLFFGREDDTVRLLGKVLSHQICVLFGELGVGKTSLLKAGLLPRLEEEGFLPLYARCFDDPTRSIQRVAAQALSQPLGDRGTTLADSLRQVMEQTGQDIVVFLDQSQELFTRLGPETRETFAHDLVECLSLEGERVHFVLSIREDLLSRLYELRQILPTIVTQVYKLERLTPEQAQEAIVRPVAKFQLSFEELLVTRLVEDLNQDGIRPIELQIVCDRLWDTWEIGDRSIRYESYRRLGGAKRILEQMLERQLRRFRWRRYALARTVLREMVTSLQTRTLLRSEEIAANANLEAEVVEEVLAELQEARLVRCLKEEGETRYELRHDYLVERMRDWLRPSAQELRGVHELLRREVNDWQRFGRLLSPETLKQAYRYRRRLQFLPEELELLIRSAAEHQFQMSYWFGRCGELPTDRQVALCTEFLNHPERAVREVIVQAMKRLDRDALLEPLVEALRASGAQTLTIAPEAGSARLRDVIAKTQTEAQLLDAVALAAELDFPQIKFYFMIGHPTETQEDLEELVAFALKARDIFKRRIAMNATPFVPKAHTPFQWMAMTDARTLKKRQSFITRRLGKHRIAVRADSPAWAEVQAVLARGDRRLAQVILDIPRLSVRDFWETMARHGLDRDAYLGQLPLDQPMPWEIVASGVKPAFFRQEWRRAQQARLGPHCPPDSAGCLACGVCDPAWAFRFQPDKLRKKPDFDH